MASAISSAFKLSFHFARLTLYGPRNGSRWASRVPLKYSDDGQSPDLWMLIAYLACVKLSGIVFTEQAEYKMPIPPRRASSASCHPERNSKFLPHLKFIKTQQLFL